MKNIIFAILLLAQFFIGFKAGQEHTFYHVSQNCRVSGLNNVICSNYIKVIKNKEWLRLK